MVVVFFMQFCDHSSLLEPYLYCFPEDLMQTLPAKFNVAPLKHNNWSGAHTKFMKCICTYQAITPLKIENIPGVDTGFSKGVCVVPKSELKRPSAHKIYLKF